MRGRTWKEGVAAAILPPCRLLSKPTIGSDHARPLLMQGRRVPPRLRRNHAPFGATVWGRGPSSSAASASPYLQGSNLTCSPRSAGAREVGIVATNLLDEALQRPPSGRRSRCARLRWFLDPARWIVRSALTPALPARGYEESRPFLPQQACNSSLWSQRVGAASAVVITSTSRRDTPSPPPSSLMTSRVGMTKNHAGS